PAHRGPRWAGASMLGPPYMSRRYYPSSRTIWQIRLDMHFFAQALAPIPFLERSPYLTDSKHWLTGWAGRLGKIGSQGGLPCYSPNDLRARCNVSIRPSKSWRDALC